MVELTLRAASRPEDGASVWQILEPVFRAGDTYTVDPDISPEEALDYWFGASHGVVIAEAGGVALGTYYLKRNQAGGGAHVCNCGYVTAPEARGRGVARSMLAHSLERARAVGFAAMQFNFVVETNARAIDIWRRAGFREVGRLPVAFRHPRHGAVDALILWRDL
ncbi:MAG: GNAT family N-acetyltransferase [Pseudomonadota bacterium]